MRPAHERVRTTRAAARAGWMAMRVARSLSSPPLLTRRGAEPYLGLGREHETFEGLNAVALALHYYPHCPTDAGCATAPEYLLYVHTLEIISHVFTALFWVEMLLKVGGLGPRLYIMGQGGGWNAFDLFVNLLSLLDLALMTYFDSENNPSPANLNVLRTFRLLRALRVLRLTRSFPALRKVLGTIMQSSAQIFYLFLLMLIFMVAAIHFLKNMLLWIFTNLLIKVENKIVLSLTFMLSSAVMSAFLDALTVTASRASIPTFTCC